jgi:hypothetical protein
MPAPAAPTPEQAALTLQGMYEWNPTAGAERDLKADVAECQAQTNAPGLAGVAQHIQCMRDKGWNTRKPQS